MTVINGIEIDNIEYKKILLNLRLKIMNQLKKNYM